MTLTADCSTGSNLFPCRGQRSCSAAPLPTPRQHLEHLVTIIAGLATRLAFGVVGAGTIVVVLRALGFDLRLYTV
jgi:hypothetical protein